MPSIHTHYRVIGDHPAAGPLAGLMTQPIRGDQIIHVDIATILSNREKRHHSPVVAIRDLAAIDEATIARGLYWNAPSRFVHHEFSSVCRGVQNWIETDGSLRCSMDGQPDHIVLGPGLEVGPLVQPIFGRFVIHVAAPVLIRNRQEGRRDPVIAVRSAETNWAEDVIFCRRVEWNGPSRMVHRPPTPIPGTNGRGVAFVETDSPLTLYTDDAEPIVLYNWEKTS